MILVVSSSKGGVGKSTFAANLAGLLALEFHKRVLVVDADTQSTLSSYYEIAHRSENGLTHLVTKANTDHVVSKTVIDGLDIICSDDPDCRLGGFILDAADGRMRL